MKNTGRGADLDYEAVGEMYDSTLQVAKGIAQSNSERSVEGLTEKRK